MIILPNLQVYVIGFIYPKVGHQISTKFAGFELTSENPALFSVVYGWNFQRRPREKGIQLPFNFSDTGWPNSLWQTLKIPAYIFKCEQQWSKVVL